MIGIDSSILIDLLRKKISPQVFKSYETEELCTTEIVVYEIFKGIFQLSANVDKKIAEFNAVLDSFGHVFSIDRKAVLKAAEIKGNLVKSGKTVDDPDVLIAGSLLANGCTKFLTKNKKDFENIKELVLIE